MKLTIKINIFINLYFKYFKIIFSKKIGDYGLANQMAVS